MSISLEPLTQFLKDTTKKRQCEQFGNRNTSNAGGPRAGVCALGWYNASNGPSNSNANNFGAAS